MKGCVVCIIFAVLLFSCKNLEGDNGPAGLVSLIKLSTENAGDNCEIGGIKVDSGIDANGNGILENSEVTSTAYVCNGGQGKVSLVNITEESIGSNCGNGGLRVVSGIDVNGNGILEVSEITTTAFVCAGVDGKISLVSITEENTGENCENGGMKVDSGIDKNGNGILELSEVTATTYVCNGVDGRVSLVNITDENAGGNCTNGGVKITSGIDLNRNGMLDEMEIQITRYVCDGLNGNINEEIQIRLVDGVGTSANSTSTNPVIVPGISTFDIRNYPDVDSVLFVADPWVANNRNYALLELFNLTDNQVVEGSTIRTNKLFQDRSQLITGNLFDKIPKKQLRLGIKFSSETEGEFAASGIPFLFLYRSK